MSINSVDIKLLNGSKQEIVYEDVETITIPKATGSGVETFTAGVPLGENDVQIAPDFSSGDMVIGAPTGYVVRGATIVKPSGMEDVIALGESLMGVSGRYVTPGTSLGVSLNFSSGDMSFLASSAERWNRVDVFKPATLLSENVKKGVDIAGITGTFVTPGTTKSVTLDFSSGDMSIAAVGDERWNQIDIFKPATLLPENIVEGAEIAGIIGTYNAGVYAKPYITLSANAYSAYATAYGYSGTSAHLIIKIPSEAMVAYVAFSASFNSSSTTANMSIWRNGTLPFSSYISGSWLCFEASSKMGTHGSTAKIAVVGGVDYFLNPFVFQVISEPYAMLAVDRTTGLEFSITRVYGVGQNSFAPNNIEGLSIKSFGSIDVNALGGMKAVVTEQSGMINTSSIRSYLANNCFYFEAPNVTRIENSYAFSGLTKLKEISMPVCENISSAMFYNCNSLLSVYIPSCSEIASNAFQGCGSLKTVSFSVCKKVEEYAFANCFLLSSVYLPECETVGSYAFSRCSALSSIELPKCKSIYASAFYSCGALTEVNFPACTFLGAKAFLSCSLLSSVAVPECITIGANCFSGLSLLSSISLPKCESIGEAAFWCCSSLKSIVLPMLKYGGASGIANFGAFQSCKELTTVIIGNGESTIDYLATMTFAYCSKLQSVIILSPNVPTLKNTNVFNGTPISNSTYLGFFGSIYVLNSMVNAFKAASNWSVYSARIVGVDL